MMNTEHVTARAVRLAELVRALPWEWTREFWSEATELLRLQMVSETVARSTYLWDDCYVHAYFASSDLKFVVAEIDVYEPPGQLSAAEFDNWSDAYYAKYRGAVEGLTRVLGKPQFDDGAAAKGFPEDQDSVWLALWRMNGFRFMLQQRNEGPDMPFRIVVVIEK